MELFLVHVLGTLIDPVYMPNVVCPTVLTDKIVSGQTNQDLLPDRMSDIYTGAQLNKEIFHTDRIIQPVCLNDRYILRKFGTDCMSSIP